MDSTKGNPVNQKSVGEIGSSISAAHDATLLRNFYGSVAVTWQIKDGVIQQDYRVEMSENKRVAH